MTVRVLLLINYGPVVISRPSVATFEFSSGAHCVELDKNTRAVPKSLSFPSRTTAINLSIDLMFVSCSIATVEVESLVEMFKPRTQDIKQANFREVPQSSERKIFSPSSSPNYGDRYEWHGILFEKRCWKSKVKRHWSAGKKLKNWVVKTFAFAVICYRR